MGDTYDKTKDLAGPGISTYEEVAKILPGNYRPVLNPKDRMKALFKVKNFIEENLCRELNLFMVQVPLIVSKDSGVNDYLDRDGSRTPIDFPCGLGLTKRIEAQVVQAATKWKRIALKQFDCQVASTCARSRTRWRSSMTLAGRATWATSRGATSRLTG